ncbi:hypothetical protein MtrunA17_Chr7g0226751 [Medicago truncatula]|uniref:Uncharacterized protein n=1 Tax=Medicago truncatula TaxID=3880 RepID=A0A396GY19_MEDTR|nr:hypothetical protein MtrunA17_Chr7g0226751 [Medicago truncatula]
MNTQPFLLVRFCTSTTIMIFLSSTDDHFIPHLYDSHFMTSSPPPPSSSSEPASELGCCTFFVSMSSSFITAAAGSVNSDGDKLMLPVLFSSL